MTRSNRFKVYVQPRSSRSGVAGMHGDSVHIRLTAPPVDDAANEALVALVAARLGIAKRQVRVVAGLRSRYKTVEIDGVSTAVALSALLAAG